MQRVELGRILSLLTTLWLSWISIPSFGLPRCPRPGRQPWQKGLGPSSLCHPKAPSAACPEGVPVGQDERRLKVPPQPSSPEHRQLVQEAAGRGRKVPALSAVALAGQCPRQGTPSQPAPASPAGQVEGSKGQGAIPSQLAWETSRVPAQGPRSGAWRRGAGRPGGHQGSLLAKVFLLVAFLEVPTPLPLVSEQLSSARAELSRSCHLPINTITI